MQFCIPASCALGAIASGSAPLSPLTYDVLDSNIFNIYRSCFITSPLSPLMQTDCFSICTGQYASLKFKQA